MTYAFSCRQSKYCSLPVVAFRYGSVRLPFADLWLCHLRVLADDNFFSSGKHRLEVLQLGLGGETADEQQLIGPVSRPCCNNTSISNVGGDVSRQLTALLSVHECDIAIMAD